MIKILTITFNPAIDKSTAVVDLIPERKLTCAPPVFEPGGGGINVARAIQKLGGQAAAAYLAGGFSGRAFTQLLTTEGVSCFPTEIEGNTRENLVVVENSSGKQYRFGMPGPHVNAVECQALLDSIDGIPDLAFIIVSGSMPPGMPVTVFKAVSSIAESKNARFIVDTSGEALQEAVNSGVYLIKPNLRELGHLVGEKEIKPENVVEHARSVIRTGSCEVIVVSMADKGAILVTAGNEVRVIPPKVQTISTVGAGDSMLAGIVYSLWQGRSLQEAVRFGVACGTAATLNPGTELCHSKDATYLYSLIEVN